MLPNYSRLYLPLRYLLFFQFIHISAFLVTNACFPEWRIQTVKT